MIALRIGYIQPLPSFVIVIAKYFSVRGLADRVAILTTCKSAARARSIHRTVLETFGPNLADVLIFPSASLPATAASCKR